MSSIIEIETPTAAELLTRALSQSLLLCASDAVTAFPEQGPNPNLVIVS